MYSGNINSILLDIHSIQAKATVKDLINIESFVFT